MSASPISHRAALPTWATELARLWNSGAHSLFLLHGNIHDLFPVAAAPKPTYAALGPYLSQRLFPTRAHLLHYDLGAGLTFATPAMQTRFFEWLKIYDEVENTTFHRDGPPRVFVHLLPVLRRFFLRMAEETGENRGVTLVVNFAEKLVPASEENQAAHDERVALVTLLSWAASPELHHGDVGVILVTETISELHGDLLQNPHVARVRIDLPVLDERAAFLGSGWLDRHTDGKTLAAQSDLPTDDLARRTSGLPLLRIEQLLATALRNDQRITASYVSAGKRTLIEDYCGDLVKFKDPKVGRSLDDVATHVAAKTRLRELAWLIREGKHAVLERGVLVPGRIGVGKSYLIDCFASECGLPVLELGQFRSKWVGETERQQARILLTIRALGPVIVVVDEADAVFGNRSADGDSGVSSRVFAAFAAHLGDSSLRGRELWIAMTSRPDLMAIDLKRQGRFGLCVPLFPAQNPDEIVELFSVIARSQKLALAEPLLAYIREKLGGRPLTGSDVEAVLVRARERAVLAKRDDTLELEDLQTAVDAFIDPLDENLLALQEAAAVLACSDRRFLPENYQTMDRSVLRSAYESAKRMLRAD
ncbi:ATP-binding protein [Rariglobus hedericola]|uniref:ATP-binding protein n=1 Tax=Rariglobus hedericola TaxID=2597822 RepID=A0A556QJK8_9BACT|nr:ATP-binding protein [Rariglobus hedericola]TSJ76834.1 ATP-binding protein [Rariglobus hedericola]